MGKKFKRRDGFRGEKVFFGGPHPLTINPTKKDVQKRLTQKMPLKKKK